MDETVLETTAPDDITAEYAPSELTQPAKLSTRVRLRVGAKSDLGRVRENNEDKFEYYIPQDDTVLAARGSAFLVCDGMGGHAAGQIASELAAKTFIDVYYSHSAEEPIEAIIAAIRAANRYVLDVGRSVQGRRGMGTTLTALIIRENSIWVGQAGDSRLYRLRDGNCERLTRDHTFVEESIRFGSMTKEEAEVHPHRHVLTRAVGAEDLLVPDVEKHDLRAGDRFILCSDGLTNHVSDAAIGDAMSRLGPSELAWFLIGLALQDGGSDNTTVLSVFVDGLDPVEPEAAAE